jgi:hypothetical protein
VKSGLNDNLVKATAYAKIRPAGWRHRPTVTAETMAAELAASLQDLARTDPEPVDTGPKHLRGDVFDA